MTKLPDMRVTADGVRLDLTTGEAMTPSGLLSTANFFSGFVDRADLTASGILAVADVAARRYADPGLAQRLAAMDPVVTAGGDRLRFESFSLCNGVYARFDLTRTGLGTSTIGLGTTNVDINQPLRTALAQVRRTDPLHLQVGADELQVSSMAGTHTEPKVKLPDRWVRGLAETSQLLSEMDQVASSTGTEARRFLSGLPRSGSPGPELHVLPMRGGWRTTSRSSPSSVSLSGASRLNGADRMLRFTDVLTVHRHPHGSTAWVFTVPGGALTLALSPTPYRGFSGEGTLLTLLTHPKAEETGRRLQDHLAWNSVIDPSALAKATAAPETQVRAGLGWLSASGRLGYDLAEHAWFHRELPLDSEAVVRRNPRLAAAQKLIDNGSITTGPAPAEWHVRGTAGTIYTVTSTACNCTWSREHNDSRGPCKHRLAVLLMLRN